MAKKTYFDMGKNIKPIEVEFIMPRQMEDEFQEYLDRLVRLIVKAHGGIDPETLKRGKETNYGNH
jgi:hypothetical protein